MAVEAPDPALGGLGAGGGTLPEQSLQDMPPVPRHLWQAFTTPVWGTVTTLT